MVIGFLKFKVTLAGAILTLDHCLCNFASRYQGQKKDLEFDIEQSSDRVLQWKAHLLRAINQERAKSKILANLEKHQCLIGLGHEMAAEKILRNTVGMVWEKGHKLARVSLHHAHRKYGYGI